MTAREAAPGPPAARFLVHLDVFEGPFDLLLGLIAKHRLDVTEVSLWKVTDDFVAHLRTFRDGGGEWDLGLASEFLVVAATLLDLKAARLLPSGEVEDEEDLALLEARDLLFARLLQYRAFRGVAEVIAAMMAEESLRRPRSVGLEGRFASLLPEVVMGLGPRELAALAARVLTPRPVPEVSVEHVHAPRVSVAEQAGLLVARLREVRRASFAELTADCEGTWVVVARFLALLELFRDGAVGFVQADPLGELRITWTGDEEDARG